MTELQLSLANIIREAVYAYTETLDDMQDKADLVLNWEQFVNANNWDLSCFEADSLTFLLRNICLLGGLEAGFKALEESELKTKKPLKLLRVRLRKLRKILKSLTTKITNKP